MEVKEIKKEITLVFSDEELFVIKKAFEVFNILRREPEREFENKEQDFNEYKRDINQLKITDGEFISEIQNLEI